MRKGISKWIIVIISLLSLGIGGYLVFIQVKKSKEISKNAEIQFRKEELVKEIAELKNALHNNEIYWKKRKSNEETEELGIKWINFWRTEDKTQNYSDEAIQKLEEEREKLYQKSQEFSDKFNKWIEKNNQKIDNDERTAKKWWKIQKDDSWKDLILPLANDQIVREKFNFFIKKFYWRFREEEGMPEGTFSPEPFTGFAEFNIGKDERELGHCSCHVTGWEKNNVLYQRMEEMHITINPKYLLNKGKNGTDQFICQDPAIFPNYKYVGIGFDNDEGDENDLIGTIAHELAHAIQNCEQYLKTGIPSTQCSSSGDGERDEKDKLIKAEYPELVDKHTRLSKKYKTKIINSPECQEFKSWWTS